MAGDAELCGFLDAKLPGNKCMTQRVRKRSLAPWKSWKRHWCSMRKLGPGLGVEVQLDYGIGSGGEVAVKNNSIKIPSEAIVCRADSRSKQFAFAIFPSAKERKPLLYLSGNSENETQQWMSNVRQLLKSRRHYFMERHYYVSMVDNAHSKACGFNGMHGDLVASRSGVFIKDIYSGEIKVSMEWKECSQFHLSTTGHPEDVKRICVIHTTKEFHGGVGELHLYCVNASKMLQDLVTQGRGPRRKPQVEINERPLSLSEGDLRIAARPNDVASVQKSSKVAAGLLNVGLGLLLATRSGSEAKLAKDTTTAVSRRFFGRKRDAHKRAVDNVYQPEPANISTGSYSISLEQLDENSRRVSGISVASGIYEEIIDDGPRRDFRRLPTNLYEDPDDLVFSSSAKLKPPPLPPRQRHGSGSTRNGSISDDGLDSEGDTRSATPNTQDDSTPTPEEKITTIASQVLLDNSDYVPMSPRLKDIALHKQLQDESLQENVYMIMR